MTARCTYALTLAAMIALTGSALAATSPSPTIAWEAQLGAPVYSRPDLTGRHLYLTTTNGSGDNLFALDTATGRLLWRFAAGGAIPRPPTVSHTQVFVAFDVGDTHVMRALDAKTGQRVWKYSRAQPPQCMCSHAASLAGGLLFAQTDGHSLYAFAPQAGSVPARRLWQFSGDGAKLTPPVVADGVAVIGSADHRLYGIDALTGQTRWTASTGYAFVAPPVVAHGAVLIGNRGGTLHAYDVRTGKSLWSFATGGAITSPAVPADGLVVVASHDRHVYGLTAGGKLVWATALPDYAAFAPVAVGRMVLIASRDGALYALDATTGRRLWRNDLGGTPFSGPMPWRGKAVLKVGDHRIAAIDLATGRTAWTIRRAAVVTTPVTWARHVVFGTSTGQVFAVD